MDIRRAQPDEFERLGDLVVDAYVRLDGHVHEPEYEAQLRDVAARATAPHTDVFAAVEGATLLGCTTFVADAASPFAEHVQPDEAAIRMLGVDPAAEGRGAGGALVRRCLAEARASGRRAVVLHTTPWMHRAHRLYEHLGFTRDPALDWAPSPDVPLLGYRFTL